MHTPIIALANDDGIKAAGLQALEEALKGLGDVWVVAPDRERSATSHGISLHDPMRLREVGPQRYSLDGLPADCMYVALNHLLPRRPALVVSGINNGPNLGTDILYSGTVGAAMEGALNGVPAIAASLCLPEVGQSVRTVADYAESASFIASLAKRILAAPPKPGMMFNVNVPVSSYDGERPFKVTRLGVSDWENSVDERHDPRGKSYLWIGGRRRPGGTIEESDNSAIADGVISVTPLHFDLTDPSGFDYLKSAPLDGKNRMNDALSKSGFERVDLPERKLGIES